jgi:Domain of unknown function (DUF1844)
MDAPEEEKDRGFKVDDRRRFSAEGELKPEYRKEEDQPKAGAAPIGGEPKPRESAAPQAGKQGPKAEADAQTDASDMTFGTFLVSLSTQALLSLGEIPDPATGERTRDLPAAQQLIDIIGILREKTRGNLDRDEQSLLDAVLFDLRMKYVEIARQPAR